LNVGFRSRQWTGFGVPVDGSVAVGVHARLPISGVSGLVYAGLLLPLNGLLLELSREASLRYLLHLLFPSKLVICLTLVADKKQGKLQ
jgi:hypothetical protein